MERIRSFFREQNKLPSAASSTAYEPLVGGSIGPDGETIETEDSGKPPFSWVEYSIFTLLGVAMLWAWNMFMAAAPYFQKRFASSPGILAHFQSSILSVATVANLSSMLVLQRLQARANYPRRIYAALFINAVVVTLLALSTVSFLRVSTGIYFAFVLAMVLLSSIGTGLIQNGTFSYLGGFEWPQYTQGVMFGQAVAGVLPCIVQIISVLSVPEKDPSKPVLPTQESSKSAFYFFITATIVLSITLVAFIHLVRLQNAHAASKHLQADLSASVTSLRSSSSTQPRRKTYSMWYLLKRTNYIAISVFLCFAITMVFPVFTQAIPSIHPLDPSTPRLLHPSTFIPLAILIWNMGDLLGRLLTLLTPTPPPRLLALLAVARLLFIPGYYLCNVGGRGAVVKSDLFYLVLIQLFFGISNGWVGSSGMVMGGADLGDGEEEEEDGEREARGGFMGLCLIAGLSAGSLASFAVKV